MFYTIFAKDFQIRKQQIFYTLANEPLTNTEKISYLKPNQKIRRDWLFMLLRMEFLRCKVGSWKTEVGSWKTEVGSRESGVRSLKTEVGRQKTEVGSQKTEVGSQKCDVGRNNR